MEQSGKFMNMYCSGCEHPVHARLTNGGEMYPHRPDLARLPFWVCDTCQAFVGCHHKTHNQTRPLGCLATKELKQARRHIHDILDPLWKNHKMSRGAVYGHIAKSLGNHKYHTANIRTIEEAREVYRIVNQIR